MDNAGSQHYAGEAGRRYFAERFNARQHFGRQWQSRYFLPYCKSSLTLLDFGCGDGTISRQLPAARKLAVEVNPHCVQVIEQQNEQLGERIEVVADIASVPDACVDLLISNHSLEHVPSPYHVLCQMRRVLRPTGMLVLVTPFDDWRSDDNRAWQPGDRQNHLYTWSPVNIGNLLVEAGFEVESSALQSTAWSPKIFWVRNIFGTAAFRLACRLLAAVINRREVLSVARPVSGPREPHVG